MTFWKLAGTSLLLASIGPAQDISPQTPLLERVKSHMREELTHLPNYTCLETITRFHKEPARQSRHLEPLDTVRLEIVYSNHREWYGMPGDRNFGIGNLQQFVGGGVIGTGAFAMILHNVYQEALITYRGPDDLGGRMAVKYDFRMPGEALEISIPGGFGKVGQEGSLWTSRRRPSF